MRKMSKKAVKVMTEKVNAEAQQGDGSGWTVSAYGKQRGTPWKNSYMVALPKSQVEEPIASPLHPADVSNYQSKFKHLLRMAGYAHGGWIPKEGEGTQDVSVGFPRTEEGLKAAMRAASNNEQQAVGNLGSIKNKAGSYYVGDINIPEHLRRDQFAKGNPHAYPEEMQVTLGRVGPGTTPVVRINPSRSEMVEVEAEGLSKGWFKDKEGKTIPPPPREHDPEDRM